MRPDSDFAMDHRGRTEVKTAHRVSHVYLDIFKGAFT